MAILNDARLVASNNKNKNNPDPKGTFLIKSIAFVVISIFTITVVLMYQSKNGDDSLPSGSNSLSDSNSPNDSSTIEVKKDMLPAAEDAYSTNQETVGWIKVPGTSIDYPVLQTLDNTYYLSHNFNKEADNSGAAFIHTNAFIDNSLMSDNLTLYGTNKNDGIFSDLSKYKDIEFYKKNPVIEFNSNYNEYKWKVISIFVTNSLPSDGDVFDYGSVIDFESEEIYEKFIKDVMDRNYYLNDIEYDFSDKYITLSTDSYEITGAKLLVVARRVRDGEDEAVDTSKIKKNPNPLRCKTWIELYGN